MAASINSPKVFISYSWNPIVNKQKATTLAERLSNDGVNVIFDDWNLSEGQDKYQFMEQMVTDSAINRVLIICNKDYTDKANNKKGGVGTESLIMSDDIYSKADQKKFVPVLFERDSDGKEYVPVFIKSRIYIDLSNESIYEEQYERLLRNIYDKPLSKKPPLGTPPAYILQEDQTFLQTSHKVGAIKKALLEEKRNYQIYIDDYYNSFIKSLNQFVIADSDLILQSQHIDELVLIKFEALKDLRNDYIFFLETLFTYSSELDLEKFIEFYEKLIEFQLNQDTSGYPSQSRAALRTDQFKVFYYELFLYTTAVMVDKDRFKQLGQFLNHTFLVYNKQNGNTTPFTFIIFNQIAESLNKFRNDRLGMNRINISADLIKQRADHSMYPFEKLREYDIILYYLSCMATNSDTFQWSKWFPQTTAYHVHRISMIDKMVSVRYFNKMRLIFNVDTKEELKKKVEDALAANADRLQRWHYEFPQLEFVFDFERIGIYN